jgi:cold shock CspA family protein
MKIPGKISKWVALRWFGYVWDGHQNIFVHGSDLVEGGISTEDTGELVGTEVMFDIGHSPDGRQRAVDIKKVEE